MAGYAAGTANVAPAPGLSTGANRAEPPASAATTGAGRELQQEISGTIEAQVQRLLEQARVDTESKVKAELKMIRDSMLAMDSRLDLLLNQLNNGAPLSEGGDSTLDAEMVGQLLQQTEQRWGQEIRTLKQELHQTILAHNHNADLIKHHKDTIDALKERCQKMQGSSNRTAEIQQQLARLDARLKQQQKQRKLEPLFERLAALEQRVAAAIQSQAWKNYSAAFALAPSVPPGIAAPPGISALAPGLSSATGLLGKAAAPKAQAAPAASAGLVGSAAKTNEKAAFKCPTDEEVQARLSKLSPGGEAAPTDTAEA